MKRSVLAILMVAGTILAPHVEAQTASAATAASSPPIRWIRLLSRRLRQWARIFSRSNGSVFRSI